MWVENLSKKSGVEVSDTAVNDRISLIHGDTISVSGRAFRFEYSAFRTQRFHAEWVLDATLHHASVFESNGGCAFVFAVPKYKRMTRVNVRLQRLAPDSFARCWEYRMTYCCSFVPFGYASDADAFSFSERSLVLG